MAIAKPFNLNKWINENRYLLKPPVGNKNLYVDSEANLYETTFPVTQAKLFK